MVIYKLNTARPKPTLTDFYGSSNLGKNLIKFVAAKPPAGKFPVPDISD